ncbi:hypothetical protein GWN63_06090 [Candidatus Bathyarchaeota archaeon]|nr:hypothetical protein [Candidatus Bathyarchaeota archaeon]NIU81791.1 hypothetical protein [Candidatus Bathyarchaeota archaeon]NIV68430.1 hypothetical protein [Candidatus Bathyarchaeota archaeon]NIW16729.1 hypothetical protein [Candidatus Bathyarchaeota archaeon]NIW34929.1 hypothetical protein [Candidatus Bathyarchaeota archaeon]
MTNLKKRLDSAISELMIIRDVLDKADGHPPCCFTIGEDGEVGCDTVGPLPKQEFWEECQRCRRQIRSFLEKVGLEDR